MLLLLVLAFVLLGADAGAKLRARRKKTANREPLPIAFYLAGGDRAATPEAAIAQCNAKRRVDRDLFGDRDRKPCEASVVTVRGPFVRPPDDHEDHRVYVYRGTDAVWYSASGERAD